MLYSISADLTGNGEDRRALLSLYFLKKGNWSWMSCPQSKDSIFPHTCSWYSCPCFIGLDCVSLWLPSVQCKNWLLAYVRYLMLSSWYLPVRHSFLKILGNWACHCFYFWISVYSFVLSLSHQHFKLCFCNTLSQMFLRFSLCIFEDVDPSPTYFTGVNQ